MENKEAFTGISAEPEESMDEVNWRQNNDNPASRGRGYFNRGSGQGYNRGSNYQHSSALRGRGYNSCGNNSARKTGTVHNPDVRCLLCGLKSHEVTTCRKLTRAQELIRLDRQYWNKKKEAGKSNISSHTKRYQINEVDEAESVNGAEHQLDEEDIDTDCD